VPICASKCAYCDFYSLPRPAFHDGFEGALVDATSARARELAERFGSGRGEIPQGFDTVYIGGGTPTMLSLAAMDKLFSAIASLAAGPGGRPPLEWSVEANPDSLSPEALDLMRERGVTRVSIGVQSLDSGELKLLGRAHDPERALASVALAASRGFAVSADLIAGIPAPRGRSRQSEAGRDGLARYAKELVEAGASHISAYDLSLEEGTPLEAMKSSLDFPSEDEAWEERRLLEAALRCQGFRRYEVSNYAPPGRECLHNMAYWRMDSYIGAGAGAVSTIASQGGSSLRIEEAKDAQGYASSGAAFAAAAAVETEIGRRDSAFETVMMSFRTSFGLDLDAFSARFGVSAEELLARSLESWKSHLVPGEASTAGGRSIALDGEGLDILNRFLVDCLEEIESRLEP
jgi:oxygen-independent coproporphyrinogen III oxidase